ncbi:HotDog domain-containing protein [Kockiozyma suomiensis]|uniref:HotDog domain-containing protein n=1 Tax=Kockiozyma suomiensis TaxID=1337062 RepID=UPI0033440637
MAAIKTVPEAYQVHSMHCYFLLAGDASVPVLYAVEHIREGKSYCTRTVQARQKGRCIFSTTISFQIPAKAVLNHSLDYPGRSLPQPETVPDFVEQAKSMYKKGVLSKADYENAAEIEKISPVEARAIVREYPPGSTPPDRRDYMWIKAKGTIQELNAHIMALAYMSDRALLGNSVRVNQVDTNDVRMMVSLDHSIYFHAPVKADEWLLFEMHSPWTGSARGLVYGSIFTRTGTLVASIIQEGVVRLRDPKQSTKPKL